MFTLYSPSLLRSILLILTLMLGVLLTAIQGHPCVAVVLFFVTAFSLLVGGFFAFNWATSH